MILIDLPMPEACDVRPFNYDFCWCKAFGNHDEWEKYSDDWNDHVCDRETRPKYCPLKEQDAVVPGLAQYIDGIFATCGNCKTKLWKIMGLEFVVNPDEMPKFCPHCGRAVKWE